MIKFHIKTSNVFANDSTRTAAKVKTERNNVVICRRENWDVQCSHFCSAWGVETICEWVNRCISFSRNSATRNTIPKANDSVHTFDWQRTTRNGSGNRIKYETEEEIACVSNNSISICSSIFRCTQSTFTCYQHKDNKRIISLALNAEEMETQRSQSWILFNKTQTKRKEKRKKIMENAIQFLSFFISYHLHIPPPLRPLLVAVPSKPCRLSRDHVLWFQTDFKCLFSPLVIALHCERSVRANVTKAKSICTTVAAASSTTEWSEVESVQYLNPWDLNTISSSHLHSFSEAQRVRLLSWVKSLERIAIFHKILKSIRNIRKVYIKKCCYTECVMLYNRRKSHECAHLKFIAIKY